MAKKFLFVCAGLSVLASALCASRSAADVVIDARPTIRLNATDEQARRSVASTKERDENRLTIVSRDGRYFWQTRENREMMRRASGAFVYFISDDGAGYVKVLDTRLLPEAVRPAGPRYRYMEHVSIMLGTITYWGSTEAFEPVAERSK